MRAKVRQQMQYGIDKREREENDPILPTFEIMGPGQSCRYYLVQEIALQYAKKVYDAALAEDCVKMADLGSGHGYFSICLLPYISDETKNLKIFSVDGNSFATEAQKVGFNFISCMNVFHLMSHNQKKNVINHVSQLLSSNGIFIFSVIAI